MSASHPAPGLGGRARLNAVLYLVVVLVLCALVWLTVLAVRDARADDDRGGSGDPVAGTTRDKDGNDLYASVVDAASEEVLAFVNIDYRDMEKSTDKVLAGAADPFAQEYTKSLDRLRTVLTESKAVMTGEVTAAGVVNADQDSARVLVATEGTVENVSTGGKQSERNLRIQVDLVWTDGDWRTSEFRFVS